MRKSADPKHKLIPFDEVTFAPGTGIRWPSGDRWEYVEYFNIDFGGILDKAGRTVGYEINIRSPDQTAKDYAASLEEVRASVDKWYVSGHYTRNGESFGGSASRKYLDDRNACVAHAKRELARIYKTSVAKFGAPAKLASRVAERYLARQR